MIRLLGLSTLYVLVQCHEAWARHQAQHAGSTYVMAFGVIMLLAAVIPKDRSLGNVMLNSIYLLIGIALALIGA